MDASRVNFVSFSYFYFLLVVVVLRWMLPKASLRQWLLLCSGFFYLSSGLANTLILCAVIGSTYLLALALEHFIHQRRLLILAGVAFILFLLALFKYHGFLSEQLQQLLQAFGLTWSWPVPAFLLPMGFSFYCFQIISYLVDVYRGRPAERSLLAYALYVSFFPTVASGPITRAGELLDAFKNPAGFDGGACTRGIYLLLRGLLKKVVFADHLGVFVDSVFAHPADASSLGAWLSVICYAGQIYCDFSGYTDMARGSAAMLGFDLPQNFLFPYLASSPQDFWRRWHVTLSRWLRDYLYIPLGGSRGKPASTYRNLMITMALGGLWHGAAWRFVIWGVYHGLLLCLHRAWSAMAEKSAGLMLIRRHWVYRSLAVCSTFLLISLGWILFGASSLSQGWQIVGQLFSSQIHFTASTSLLTALILVGLLAVGHGISRLGNLERIQERTPAVFQGLLWAGMIGLIYVFAGAQRSFIYAQF